MPAKKIKCEVCGKPATNHFTRVESGGKRTEMHLCEQCAQEKKVLSKQELNLSTILQHLIGTQVGALSEELSRLACPVCGIKYMEFRAEGRLGCPHDYEVFRAGLEPLLLRIHRVAHHVGKRPRHRQRSMLWQRELLDLRQKLRQAVDREDFEQAAKLRDLIRQKENHG